MSLRVFENGRNTLLCYYHHLLPPPPPPPPPPFPHPLIKPVVYCREKSIVSYAQLLEKSLRINENEHFQIDSSQQAHFQKIITVKTR